VLDQLTAGARADAEARQELLPFAQLDKIAERARVPLDGYSALSPTTHVRVIAEIKRSSPSKGSLASIDSAANLAEVYADAGADAISVLTEERKFGGSLDDLRAVRDAVDVPLLRKDFISSEYQLLEARAFGADVVLLIVAALSPLHLKGLHNFAESLGLAVLVETHSEDEVRLAMDIGSQLVGVNARDLSTFEINRNLFGAVRHLFDKGVTAVAESAVEGVDDVSAYRNAGADVVLVGEALVRAQDPAALITQFRKVD
jgi:indole-3-glycerol phosphate synthase